MESQTSYLITVCLKTGSRSVLCVIVLNCISKAKPNKPAFRLTFSVGYIRLQ